MQEATLRKVQFNPFFLGAGTLYCMGGNFACSVFFCVYSLADLVENRVEDVRS